MKYGQSNPNRNHPVGSQQQQAEPYGGETGEVPCRQRNNGGKPHQHRPKNPFADVLEQTEVGGRFPCVAFQQPLRQPPHGHGQGNNDACLDPAGSLSETAFQQSGGEFGRGEQLTEKISPMLGKGGNFGKDGGCVRKHYHLRCEKTDRGKL